MAQRGKDGHLTLSSMSSKPGDDFFSNPLGGGGGVGSSASGGFGRSGSSGLGRAGSGATSGGGGGAPALAQQKFGNAKSISSRDFQPDDGQSAQDKVRLFFAFCCICCCCPGPRRLRSAVVLVPVVRPTARSVVRRLLLDLG